MGVLGAVDVDDQLTYHLAIGRSIRKRRHTHPRLIVMASFYMEVKQTPKQNSPFLEGFCHDHMIGM